MLDEPGRPIDGDQVLGVIARSWRRAGRLEGGGIAATVMSNLALEKFLNGQGLELHRTKVGDRYVVEHMRAHGLNLGGEQSGHMLMTDYATTGDGIIAALQVLAVLVDSGQPASIACRAFDPLPQKLRSIRFKGPSPLDLPRVKAAKEDAAAQLGRNGRLLIRESGTEPVVRVMAEGDDEALVARVVDELCGVIEGALAIESVM